MLERRVWRKSERVINSVLIRVSLSSIPLVYNHIPSRSGLDVGLVVWCFLLPFCYYSSCVWSALLCSALLCSDLYSFFFYYSLSGIEVSGLVFFFFLIPHLSFLSGYVAIKYLLHVASTYYAAGEGFDIRECDKDGRVVPVGECQ